MFKRLIALVGCAFFIISCVHHRAPVASPVAAPPAPTKTKQIAHVANFTSLNVEGRVNLSLHTGYKKSEVILTGDPRDLAQLKIVVVHDSLYITLGKGFPHFGEVTAEVRGHFLNKFKYVGAGVIRAKHLHTSYLSIYLENQGSTELGGYIGLRHLFVKGSGYTQISGVSSPYLEIQLIGSPKVQIKGTANLAKLDIDGTSWLSLYWVRSENLKIRSRVGGNVRLAGTVNRLELELWGKSRFYGKYLRANRTFVKTHGRSVAEISSINHQSTLATDASDIYYYKLPDTRADFMAYNGSVLDMRDWNDPYFKDFTIYNKQFP